MRKTITFLLQHKSCSEQTDNGNRVTNQTKTMNRSSSFAQQTDRLHETEAPRKPDVKDKFTISQR